MGDALGQPLRGSCKDRFQIVALNWNLATSRNTLTLMPWGFLDWVRGRPYERDPEQLSLPQSASVSELRQMSLRLLDEKRRWDAYKLLREQPDAARPVLESLLRTDNRFRSMRQDRSDQTLFQRVLEILLEWESAYALQETLKLVRSSDPHTRAIPARLLAATGKADFIPELTKLVNDPDETVRNAVGAGLANLLDSVTGFAKYSRQSDPPLDSALALALYEPIRSWAFRTDRGYGCHFARALLIADRDRAAKDLTAATALTLERTWLHSILHVMRHENIDVPSQRIVSLLQEAKAIYDRDDFNIRDHGQSQLVTELLLTLARQDRPLAMGWIAILKSHRQEEARRSAQNAREELSPPFFSIALRALKVAGDVHALPLAHRTVYLVWILDAEIANGGIWQWLANSSGKYGHETVDALREVAATDAARLLEQFLDEVGPNATSSDQRTRMAAIDRVMDTGIALPGQSELWKEGAELRALVYDYAEKHLDAFTTDPP